MSNKKENDTPTTEAAPQYPDGFKPVTDCTKEELIQEIKRLQSSNAALKRLIVEFVEKI